MKFKMFMASAAVLTSIPLTSAAEEETTGLNGTGSKDHPYTIETASDLQIFRTNLASGKYREKYKGKYFVLTSDIHLNDNVLDEKGDLRDGGNGLNEFTPIGEDDYYRSFQGYFDGQGHTVYGLYIKTDNKDAGFFGYMRNGSISNLNFKDSYVSGKTSAGIVLGRCREGEVRNCDVQGLVEMSGETYQAGLIVGYGDDVAECNTEGKVCVSTISGEFGAWNCIAGGIGGQVDWISECNNHADVHASGWCAIGGVAGSGRSIVNSANYGTVSTDYPGGIGGITGSATYVQGCENRGEIKAFVKGARIGGIIGNAYGNTTIKGCANYTDFIVDTDSIGVGGIVAYPEADRYTSVSITSCINHGDIEVTGEKSYGGGISGKAYAASFFGCINYGDVNVPGNDAAGICSYGTYHSNAYGCANYGNISTAKKGGGIMGHSADGAVGCINYGNVSGIGENAILGGIIGRCESSSCFVKYSVNLGNISAGDYVGGIVGSSNWGGGMYSCYNGGDVSAVRPRAWVGGLAGFAGFSIRDSYNVGNIVTSGEETLAGGLAGKIFGGSSQWSMLRNCFNMGNVLSTGAGSYAGSVLGKNDTYGSYSGHMRNVFYLENTVFGNGYTDLMPDNMPEDCARKCTLEEFASLNEFINTSESKGHWEQGLYHPVLVRYDQYSDEPDPQPMAWNAATVCGDSVKIDLGRAFGNQILLADSTSIVCQAPNVLDISTGKMRALELSEDFDFRMPENMNGFIASEARYCRLDTAETQTIVLPFDAEIPEGMSAWVANKYEDGVLYCAETESLQAGHPYIVFRSDTAAANNSVFGLNIPASNGVDGIMVKDRLYPSDYMTASFTDSDLDDLSQYFVMGLDGAFHQETAENITEAFRPVAIINGSDIPETVTISLDEGSGFGITDEDARAKVDVFNLNGIKIASGLTPDSLTKNLKPGLYILSNGKRILISE